MECYTSSCPTALPSALSLSSFLLFSFPCSSPPLSDLSIALPMQDVDDMVLLPIPDWMSVMTYVSFIYNKFGKTSVQNGAE